MKLKDICPSARDFVKRINLSINGEGTTDTRISEYTFCKNQGISKVDMDNMAEEDVLAFSWMMRRESKSKNNKR